MKIDKVVPIYVLMPSLRGYCHLNILYRIYAVHVLVNVLYYAMQGRNSTSSTASITLAARVTTTLMSLIFIFLRRLYQGAIKYYCSLVCTCACHSPNRSKTKLVKGLPCPVIYWVSDSCFVFASCMRAHAAARYGTRCTCSSPQIIYDFLEFYFHRFLVAIFRLT